MAKAKRSNGFATYGNTPYYREKRIVIVLSSFFAVMNVLLLEARVKPDPIIIGGTALLGCVITAIDFVDRRKEQISMANAVVHVLLLSGSLYLAALSVPIPWLILICAVEILIIFCTCVLSWWLRTHPAKRVNERNNGRLHGKGKEG